MTALPHGPRFLPSELYKFVRQPYRFFSDNQRRYGDLFHLRFPGVGSVVFLADPAMVRELLRLDKEGRFGIRDAGFLEPIAGRHSLLLTDGERHERQRRLLLPPFHGQRMRAYGEMMRRTTRDVVAGFRRGQPVVVQDAMVEISFNVVTSALLGVDDPARARHFHERLRRFLDTLSPSLLFQKALRIDLGRFSPWGRFRAAAAACDALLGEEVAARRARDAGGGEPGIDILSLLLAARDSDGSGLADDEIREQLLTLFILGHESTAAGLAWGVHALLRAPAALATLRAELDALPPDADPDTIARQPYLEAVCKEILRLHTVVPELRRRFSPDPIALLGHHLPGGIYLAPAVYLIHRNPGLYPDGETFRPERFLERTFQAHEYLPFGGGARSCIGGAFALYEMKMVLSTLLGATEMRLCAGQEVLAPRRQNLSIAPRGGVRVIAWPRRAGEADHGVAARVARTPLAAALGVGATLRTAAGLDDQTLDEMWRLYAPGHQVERREFAARARDEMDQIALFREREGGALVGFTGVRTRRFTISSRAVNTLYLGLTFIDPAFRGHHLVQRTVIRTMLKQRLLHPGESLYIWSDCITYKPYLLAARNLRDVFPSPSRPTPPEVRELIDTIGRTYYGAAYRSASGTVEKPARRVVDATTAITESDLTDPHVRFYAAANPGHARGDGLIAVYPATLRNFVHFLGRQARGALSARGAA